MRGSVVVRTVTGSLIAGAIVALATGCGSVGSGGSGGPSAPVATSADELEPAAEAASDDGAFAEALSWPIQPDKWASVSGRLVCASPPLSAATGRGLQFQ